MIYPIEIFEGLHYTLHIESTTQYEWGILYDEIKNWFKETIIFEPILKVNSKTQSGLLYFEKEEDAMAFKLRWL